MPPEPISFRSHRSRPKRFACCKPRKGRGYRGILCTLYQQRGLFATWPQYDIFKNSEYDSYSSYRDRLSPRARPIRYGRHCHNRPAGSRSSLRDDCQLFHVCLSRPVLDACLRGPAQPSPVASQTKPLLRRQRLEGTATGVVCLFCAVGTNLGSGSQARHPLSLDATGHSASRRHHCTNRL